MSGSTDALPRLLAVVPWLLSHPGTPIPQIAAEFGVSAQQMQRDIELIWMCGLPGHTPGDLMDVVWEGDRVTLSNADTIAKPLRLTPQEALALVAALRALSGVPGLVETAAIDRALAKLEAAAGSAVSSERVVAAGHAEIDSSVMAATTAGLADGRRLHLRYLVPARDEVTERDVDPVRLFTGDGATYLSGWCLRVDALRTFRLDRIIDATVLDVAAEVHEDARGASPDPKVFTPDPGDRLVTLEIDPAARWVADYYPCEEVIERGDGGLVVKLRTRDDGWIRRLALGLAGSGRVVDPPELAELVLRSAHDTLLGYGYTLKPC
jgi:proteasome accessory factor C